MTDIARMVCRPSAPLLVLLTTVSSCFAEPAAPTLSADASVSAVFRDALGARYAASATPRDLEIALDGADARAGTAAALMYGALRPPFAFSLTASSLRAHRIPIELAAQPGGLLVRSLQPLDPGALYTLLWLAPANKAAFVFQTSRDPALGARFVASLPGAGAVGVAPNLARALLAFEGDLARDAAALHLRAGADEIAGAVQRLRCESLGLAAGDCLAFLPATELSRQTRYELSAELLMSTTGAQLAPVTVAFETGADLDALAPRLQPLRCDADEQRVGSLCARIDERRALLRGATDEGAFVSLASAPHVRATLTSANLFTLAELPLDGENSVLLSLRDTAGNSVEEPLLLAPQPPLPRVLIDEVRADPKGAEAALEYVELWNGGEQAASLRGFTLSSSDRRRTIAGQAAIAVGERVLLVSPEFEPALDRALPSGVRVLALDGALALPNGGGTLVLRDGAGAVTSAVQFGSALVEGQCHARAYQDPNRGAVSLLLDPDGACTPGAPTLHAP